MKLSIFTATILFTLSACDQQVQDLSFRNGDECETCKKQVAEGIAFDLNQYLKYDFSLGMMLSCLATGSPEDECMKLVLEAGGQIDTYMKWVQVNEEGQTACDEVCQ